MIRVLSERPRDKPVIVLSGRNEPTDATPLRYAAAQQVSSFVMIAEGENTADEARKTLLLLSEPFILCTSAHHQLRAFLTWVRALEVSGRDRAVRMWNLPVWQEGVVGDEEQKIRTYQTSGDCASYEAGLDYLDWRGA